MDWMEKINSENDTHTEILSFSEYMDYFNSNPARECRPSYQYLLDMLNYYGRDKNKHLKLFTTPHSDCPQVFGQFKTQESIYHNLKNFQEEGINNKFMLLVGPNGSSKTTLMQKFMKGAEEYSESKEGALYTFSWVFPIDNYVKGTLGLTSQSGSQNLNSFAHLEDKDITAIMPSELKDHPLLLIPLNQRRELIDETFKKNKKQLEIVKKSYLYKGDLSKRNRMIYDALLKNYKSNHRDVLKHIRVERFTISRRYSSSAVTVEPQLHVDARLQQITMDKRLASLPPSLQSLNLFSLQGEAVLANRGIMEFSDLLKRPLDAFKYLLMTTETATLNLQGILTELDILFVGTSNEIHLAAFKQHPDFNSFKGRFNFITVPYLTNYHEEEKIYHEQINGLKDKSTFEPHTLKILCSFAIMTRLRPCQNSNYKDKKLGTIASGLNPLEKTMLLSNDAIIPERLDSESKTILKQSLAEIMDEYENDALYEGKFGISPRDIKKIIYKLTDEHKNITIIEIIEFLENLITQKHEYDFLNISPQGDYQHPARFVTLLKEYSLDLFDKEVRSCLGLVDDRSYEDYIKKYVENVNALIKGEKIKNSITGKYEASNDFFIKEFEGNINLTEDANNFRSHLISKLGAHYLDNPNTSICYKDVFPELINRLKESYRNEQKKIIVNISKNLVFYEAEINQKEDEKKKIVTTPLSEKNRQEIKSTLDNLMSKYKYTLNGAISLLKYIIKERY